MNTYNKSLIISLTDLFCLVLAAVAAYLFRFDFDLLHKISISHALHVFLIEALCYMGMFFIFGVHRVVWRYAALQEMLKMTKWVVTGFCLSALIIYTSMGFHYVPLSILPLTAFFFLALLVFVRIAYRVYRVPREEKGIAKNILIIGAGRAAEGLLRDMLFHADKGYQPKGLLDDNPMLHRRTIRGVHVLGACSELLKHIVELHIQEVIVAIPSLTNKRLVNKVVDICSNNKIPVRVLPGLTQLVDGRVSIDALRPVAIEDLLGRDPVTLRVDAINQEMRESVVWVTGGGGSIGAELCRQIAMNQPKQLWVIDHSEYNLYRIEKRLRANFPNLQLSVALLDVAHQATIVRFMQKHPPDIIFHAAAYKHVPLLQNQLMVAVRNNVLATQHLADLASYHRVRRFVMVSTDKAVNPTSIMGATKRMAEMYCQHKNQQQKTSFITVRFGNVLGSAGSVLPLFREQLEQGGPLTVTHPDMTRYFMMIPEAVSLILRAFLMGKGGEIFVLDMGEPIKIVNLAERLIHLAGKTPYKEVPIQFTGMRPGEKLYEELFHAGESLQMTAHTQIFMSSSRAYDPEVIEGAFTQMRLACQQHDEESVLQALLRLVPEYRIDSGITPMAALSADSRVSH